MKRASSPRSHMLHSPLASMKDDTSLDSVFSGPLPSCSLIAASISFVDMSNFGNKGIIRIGIRQHRANTQEYFWYSKSRRPLISQNIQANRAITVDVGMIYSGSKVHLRCQYHKTRRKRPLDLWWFEGVICREMNGEKKNSSWIRRIARSHYRSLPVEQIISDWTCWAGRRRIYASVSTCPFFCSTRSRRQIYLFQGQSILC